MCRNKGEEKTALLNTEKAQKRRDLGSRGKSCQTHYFSASKLQFCDSRRFSSPEILIKLGVRFQMPVNSYYSMLVGIFIVQLLHLTGTSVRWRFINFLVDDSSLCALLPFRRFTSSVLRPPFCLNWQPFTSHYHPPSLLSSHHLLFFSLSERLLPLFFHHCSLQSPHSEDFYLSFTTSQRYWADFSVEVSGKEGSMHKEMAQQCESHLLSLIWPLQSLLLHYRVVKARAVSTPPPVLQQGIVLTTEMVYSCWQHSKDFKQAFDLHGLVSLCQAHLVGLINCTTTSKHLYTYRKLKLLPLQKVIMFFVVNMQCFGN